MRDRVKSIAWDLTDAKVVSEPKPLSGLDKASSLGLPQLPQDLMTVTYYAKYQLGNRGLSKVQPGQNRGAFDDSGFSRGKLTFVYRKSDGVILFSKVKSVGRGYTVYIGNEPPANELIVCPDEKLAYSLSKVSVGVGILESKAKAKAEIKAYEEEEARKKAAVDAENAPYEFLPTRVRAKYDEFEKTTTYTTGTPHEVTIPQGVVAVRMLAITDGKVATIAIAADFSGEDWIFVSKVTLLGANDKQFTFQESLPRHDILNGGVVKEMVLAQVKDRDVALLESILLSGRVRVRYDYSTHSSGYRVDWEMRGYQKRDCLDIINVYKQLNAKGVRTSDR